MRLALNLGYFGLSDESDHPVLTRAAEESGYSAVWAAEAYGSDVPTVLAWLGAQTSRIGLGAAVMQIPARTPAMTAMTAATLDSLSGGRMLLGLGVSGPQVSEGWHGVRFADPLGRTREYVEIVRQILRRERLEYAGKHFTLPLPDGPGKALKLTVRPVRSEIPIYLAAVGPKNLRLAGEIADGWLAIFLSPEHSGDALDILREARSAAGQGTSEDPLEGFDICPTVPVCITDDLEQARAAIAPYAALYIGGMGSREQNFYKDQAVRMGFADEAARIQELYLAGRHRDAADAVPVDLIDLTSLIGGPQRLAGRLQRYADFGVGTLTISPFAPDQASRVATVRGMAQILEAAGLADA